MSTDTPPLSPVVARYNTLSTPLGRALLDWGVPFMTKFYADTLARLLLSFMPLFDFLERHEIRPERVGSFGSGSCAHETLLAKLFPTARLECFDASAKYIPTYVREEMTATGRMVFQESNFDTFDWTPLRARYDFVFSIQTLEHIEDPWTALENIAGTVSPGGLLYIDTPFYSGFDENEDSTLLKEWRAHQWEKNRHFHLGFSHGRISAYLTQLGFEVIDRGYYAYQNGDARFMHFFRNSTLFKGQRANPDTALSLALTLLTLLRRDEEIHAPRFAEFDQSSYGARTAYAIRVLARKRAE